MSCSHVTETDGHFWSNGPLKMKASRSFLNHSSRNRRTSGLWFVRLTIEFPRIGASANCDVKSGEDLHRFIQRKAEEGAPHSSLHITHSPSSQECLHCGRYSQVMSCLITNISYEIRDHPARIRSVMAGSLSFLLFKLVTSMSHSQPVLLNHFS